ncbi:hypothetical protein BKA59DRAFT_481172 [Fusarium tricinctum]|uniref:Zn(2)-C6 fungal-type domain-containing protein n=1 Tax=Fusarium tricinctum TaxID=61284 RepID=A0A8K0WAY9_9HYPO|nr:hypothetical protein BKA59DRAFT_481172 [Fusarium tricinctum]
MSFNNVASRPVKACTECKQAKLRCDSKERFPNPCTRCHTRHLFCTVDAAFKRTPARKSVSRDAATGLSIF